MEIKKDVREMERNINDDTDSDSSILSDEVLVSSYPVKPRKAPKIMIPVKVANSGSMDTEQYDGKAVEQTLAFLDAIMQSKKDMYTAECEREQLENQCSVRCSSFFHIFIFSVIFCHFLLLNEHFAYNAMFSNQSFRVSIEDSLKRYRQAKQDEGNYYRVMQGFHTQALRSQMVLNRQNAMFYDVLTALQRRKEGTESIGSQTLLLQHALGKKFPINRENCDGKDLDSTISSPIPDLKKGETAVLRIDSKQSSGQLVLFKGQWIKSPMGDGQILHLLPQEEKIVVQLSFGILHANLRQALSWGREKSGAQLLELSSDNVLRQRWTALQSSFTMPSAVSRGIRSLVGQNDEEALTDKDDDNSNDDSNPTDTTTEDPSGDGTSSSSASAGRVELGRQDGSSSSSHPTSIACFPLKAKVSTTPSILSRQALKASCSSSNLPCDDDQELARTLPLIFAPPATLPHLIEAALLAEVPDIQFCQQVFIFITA